MVLPTKIHQRYEESKADALNNLKCVAFYALSIYVLVHLVALGLCEALFMCMFH